MAQKQLTRAYHWSRATLMLWLKRTFFLALLIASGWVVYKLFVASVLHGQNLLLSFSAIWAIAAYIIIPRLNRVLTRWYVPDYFIGRVRTSDCMLSDPVNLAFRGPRQDVLFAMRAAGWTVED